MVAPLVIAGVAGAAAGAAGSLFGKKAQPIDISQQLAKVSQTYNRNRELNQGMYNALQPGTEQYKTGLQEALTGARNEFNTGKNEYLGATDELTKQAQDQMRAGLYSDTFSGLPDTLRAVREASAAGGGLDTGSYQQALKETGIDTARKLVGGERDIQLQGLQNKQAAQENVFNTFNQLSQKLTSSQIDGLTKVLDTGREDLVRQYSTEMGLNEAETQSILDLMNFQQSGQMAQNSASDANRQSLYNQLISSGSQLASAKAGK